MSRTSILGGAGSLGAHVADGLLAEGHDPGLLDPRSPGAHGENDARRHVDPMRALDRVHAP